MSLITACFDSAVIPFNRGIQQQVFDVAVACTPDEASDSPRQLPCTVHVQIFSAVMFA